MKIRPEILMGVDAHHDAAKIIREENRRARRRQRVRDAVDALVLPVFLVLAVIAASILAYEDTAHRFWGWVFGPHF